MVGGGSDAPLPLTPIVLQSMKVQWKETVIVTTDIELNDPLQNFGDR
jgi:hypothetical protein